MRPRPKETTATRLLCEFSIKIVKRSLFGAGSTSRSTTRAMANSSGPVEAFNPESKSLWPAIATPVIVNDIAVVAFGRNDRGIPRLHGVQLGGSGDVTTTHRVWNRTDTGTFVPTPVEYQGKVYLVRDRGQVDCVDPVTGDIVWSDSFPRSRAAFYSSPLIAGGVLYAAREDGIVFVASVKDGFKVLAENDMGESVIASPVPSANRLFLRGERHLFCVGQE